jgi:DNA-binding CsgD family transcriptional regulator
VKSPLTTREALVTQRLIAGLSPKEIASELGISYPAVSTYIARAKRKTGARTRDELSLICSNNSTKQIAADMF